MVRLGKYVFYFFLFVVVIGCNLKSAKDKGSDSVLNKHVSRRPSPVLSTVIFSVDRQVDDDLDLNLTLVEFLDKFGMSSDEKNFILHLEKIITDPDLLTFGSNKIYTKDEFCNLLKNLGADNVRKFLVFIKVWEKYKEVVTYFENVIARVKYNDVIEELKSDFLMKQNYYVDLVKENFNAFIEAPDNYALSQVSILELDSFKRKAEYLYVFDDCYTNLSQDYKNVILFVRNILTNSNIGFAKGYKTYNSGEFYLLLGKLGSEKIIEMVKILSNLKQERALLLDSINAFDGYIAAEKDYIKRRELIDKNSFLNNVSSSNIGYSFFNDLKRAFNDYNDSDIIYSNVMEFYDIYNDHISKIKQDISDFLKAKGII
ncbi:BTA121 domain-containing protein surface lipoprotein [Borrelia hispanica]|uniref:BTA121 domain-containing protein surface lipoprotein n=1 Tax=Borrelia hispanica TaxID=40835 RepID=UPI000463A7AC|nr:hypothetical protein [Borrelia hispanica]